MCSKIPRRRFLSTVFFAGVREYYIPPRYLTSECRSGRCWQLPHLQNLRINLKDFQDSRWPGIAFKRYTHSPGALHLPVSVNSARGISRANFPIDEHSIWPELNPPPTASSRKLVLNWPVYSYSIRIFLKGVYPYPEDLFR
ncbi:predicted protein [Methanosarcina acetivorans C2A]|uniref:Uncharacterized protein n=1 Tax=Methanosarcina acetivorans (strain ATCC 35395 / DSM 2834 / JCM 12185 / C2A) TaxID=188937 RepID=Q8TL27_METAC|nr:predicted protein [Methanosarcina acetivorans C2A]